MFKAYHKYGYTAKSRAKIWTKFQKQKKLIREQMFALMSEKFPKTLSLVETEIKLKNINQLQPLPCPQLRYLMLKTKEVQHKSIENMEINVNSLKPKLSLKKKA